MFMLRPVIFLALLVAARPSFSQCATGIDAGGGACIPPDAPGMPGYQENTQPRYRDSPVWEDRWGAIADDNRTGQAGTIENQPSKEKAIRIALDLCRATGSMNCKVILSYRNQCSAVAWGAGQLGYASEVNSDRAKASALAECQKRSKSACEIVYSACSLPVKIR